MTARRVATPPSVRVVSSEQAAARDRAAIAAGIPSRALMQRAGAAAAAEIARRWPRRLRGGVLVVAGPGNNGGDGWVVARALAAVGVRVRVAEVVEAKTEDARAERALALQNSFVEAAPGVIDAWRGEPIVVDALLGIGATGEPRGPIAESIAAVARARAAGARVASLDVPSGLDASTGTHGSRVVAADLTLTFGTVKRGHLVARAPCGTIVVLDIGLGAFAESDDGAPALVDAAWAARTLPPIAADAHKGTRRKLVIIGGAEGMAGASVLAARAAMATGIGMVRVVVAPVSLGAVQEAEPAALAATWPRDDDAMRRDVLEWADAVVVGPGLGRSREAAELLEALLQAWRGPVLLDADALNLHAGRLDVLGARLAGRPALLTPHPAEFARLTSCTVDQVLDGRFELGRDAAAMSHATVLLKGTPTVITDPEGRAMVSATGTPALAAAGSGDLLSGIAGTLLAQLGDPLAAGALAAWAHGRAAELAVPHGIDDSPDSGFDTDLDEPLGAGDVAARYRGPRARRASVRGTTLDDVLAALPRVWRVVTPLPRPPVLAVLPVVGDPQPVVGT